MSNTPIFKNESDKQEYIDLYKAHLESYRSLLVMVKDSLIGPGYKLDQLAGQTIEVIDSITRTLMYDTSTEFKESHPEYKTSDDEIFIPHRSFKETVTEALKEAIQSKDSEDSEV